jgi:photosystem II stability/assembly factor-like uncharacterized protein
MNKIILFKIIVIISLDQLYSQQYWSKITDDHSYHIDNIAINSRGDVALSLANKHVIIELTDKGKTMKEYAYSNDILIPEITSKSILYDPSNNLELYNDLPLSSIYRISRENKNVQEKINLSSGLYLSKYDKLKNKYVAGYTGIVLYDSSWNYVREIYKSNKFVHNLFLYGESNNFFTTALDTSSLIYQFNSTNFNLKLLDTIPFNLDRNRFVITSKGNLLFSYNKRGLFNYQFKQTSSLNYTDSSDYKYISFIQYGIDGNIYLLSEKDFYYSQDEGLTWKKLSHLKYTLPFQINQLVIYDTSYAAALVNHYSNGDEVYKVGPEDKEWTKIDLSYNTRDFESLFYSEAGNLFGSDASIAYIRRKLLKSEDLGKSWKILTYNNFNIILDDYFNGILYGIAVDSLQGQLGIYSKDEGNSWSPIEIPGYDDPDFYFFDLKKIGKKLIALAGRKQKYATDPEDLVNFYLSEDNGNSWQFLFKRMNPAIIYDFIATDLNSNAYIKIYDSLEVSRIYVSKDYGQTISLDTRFSDFTNFTSLIFNPDGSALFVASLHGAQYKLYKTKDFKVFEELDCPFNENKPSITAMNTEKYPLVVACDFRKGIWYSKDSGSNWVEYNSGLEFYPKAYSIFKNFVFVENNRAIVSIANDGLYISNWPVETKDISNKTHEEQIYFSSVNNELKLLGNVDINLPVQIDIYDSNGKLIHSNIINNSDTSISLNDIASGVFFVTIIKEGKLLSRAKFIKLR